MADGRDSAACAAAAAAVVGLLGVQDGGTFTSGGLHVPGGEELVLNGRCSEDSPQSGRSSRDHSGERGQGTVRTTGIMKVGPPAPLTLCNAAYIPTPRFQYTTALRWSLAISLFCSQWDPNASINAWSQAVYWTLLIGTKHSWVPICLIIFHNHLSHYLV